VCGGGGGGGGGAGWLTDSGFDLEPNSGAKAVCVLRCRRPAAEAAGVRLGSNGLKMNFFRLLLCKKFPFSAPPSLICYLHRLKSPFRRCIPHI